jgi:hypothetical protein
VNPRHLRQRALDDLPHLVDLIEKAYHLPLKGRGLSTGGHHVGSRRSSDRGHQGREHDRADGEHDSWDDSAIVDQRVAPYPKRRLPEHEVEARSRWRARKELAEKTVKNDVSSINSKLEVALRAEAAAYLARHTTTPDSVA